MGMGGLGYLSPCTTGQERQMNTSVGMDKAAELFFLLSLYTHYKVWT